MTKSEFVMGIMTHFGCGLNSVVKLAHPIAVTYNGYDEEYECPSVETDLAYGIEIYDVDDFEFQLEIGIVDCDDVEEDELTDFFNELMA